MELISDEGLCNEVVSVKHSEPRCQTSMYTLLEVLRKLGFGADVVWPDHQGDKRLTFTQRWRGAHYGRWS